MLGKGEAIGRIQICLISIKFKTKKFRFKINCKSPTTCLLEISKGFIKKFQEYLVLTFLSQGRFHQNNSLKPKLINLV